MPLYTVHDFELNSGVYFFETSPEKAIFTIFHYCAFESAALANPHRNVYVIVSEENKHLKRGQKGCDFKSVPCNNTILGPQISLSRPISPTSSSSGWISTRCSITPRT